MSTSSGAPLGSSTPTSTSPVPEGGTGFTDSPLPGASAGGPRNHAADSAGPPPVPTPPVVHPTHLATPTSHLESPVDPERSLRRLRIITAAVAVAVLLLAVLTAYLYQSAQAWRDRADGYLGTSLDLGDDLATTRGDLAGAQTELEAVRAQLTTATQRISELADEKAQLRDESEVQRQLVDYQERVSSAAGQVALALDQCVRGQNEFIGFLRNAGEYDDEQLEALEQYGADVQELCERATEANIALQRELAR